MKTLDTDAKASLTPPAPSLRAGRLTQVRRRVVAKSGPEGGSETSQGAPEPAGTPSLRSHETASPSSNANLESAPAGRKLAAAVGSGDFPPVPQQAFSAFGSMRQFRDAQRMAKLLTHSSIVPETYRGEEHLGDCVITLDIANRIGASILAVLQNLQRVEGRAGWSSQFLISCVNASGRFSPIRFEMTGQRGEDSWGCVAWAADAAGTILKSPEVTLKMAKAEGWFDRPGSKWKTMPELMLCYRSAALFTRLYAPELTMGLQTAEEVMDMGVKGNGRTSRPIFEVKAEKNKVRRKSEVELKDPTPEPLSPAARSESDKPRECPAPEVTAAPVAAASTPTVAEQGRSVTQYNYLKALTGLIGLSRHSESDVLRFLYHARRHDQALASLAEVANRKPDAIVWTHDNWQAVDRELTRLKQNQTL